MVDRVVCGISADGRSTVLFSGPARARRAANGSVHEEIWLTEAPGSLAIEDLTGDDLRPLLPARAGGTRFRITTYEPGGRRPMHRTETVDYAVVLSGSVVLSMHDGGQHELHAGDCLVQLGGTHAWHNPGDEPARVAFVALAVADGATITYLDGENDIGSEAVPGPDPDES